MKLNLDAVKYDLGGLFAITLVFFFSSQIFGLMIVALLFLFPVCLSFVLGMHRSENFVSSLGDYPEVN